jgi:hypothetical protein
VSGRLRSRSSCSAFPSPNRLDVFIPEQLRANRIGLLPIELNHTFEIARLWVLAAGALVLWRRHREPNVTEGPFSS